MRGTIAGAFSIAAVLAALSGCGAESHENQARPPIPATVGVTVNAKSIRVDPVRVGTPNAPRPAIQQNVGVPSPLANPKSPAVVNVIVSNTTGRNTKLVLTGPEEYTSPLLVAGGSTSFDQGLGPGVYMVRSSASVGTARLVVGVTRASSANDVLLP